MRQEVQWDKKIWDNLWYYLLWSFIGSVICNYIFNTDDKVLGSFVWFFILLMLSMFYLRIIKSNDINQASKTGKSSDKWIWNILWKAYIEAIEIQTRYKGRIRYFIKVIATYKKEKIEYHFHIGKYDIPDSLYQEIESQYSFIEKILWILSNKSDKIIINWLKTQHNLYIWKEVIIYQNPNDPEDLVMKDPFEN